MVLLDSNIVIYSVAPDDETVRSYLQNRRYAVSIATFIEVLGYHRITSEEASDLREIMESGQIVEVKAQIVDEAIRLRQARKIGLADAIIAATALVEGWELVTRNVDDFRWIPNLNVVNPYDTPEVAST